MENKIILYATQSGKVMVDVWFEEETFWLTQKAMAALFDVETNTINYHLGEIFSSNELSENATIRKFRIVQMEGNRKVNRQPLFYNLDAIIASFCHNW